MHACHKHIAAAGVSSSRSNTLYSESSIIVIQHFAAMKEAAGLDGLLKEGFDFDLPFDPGTGDSTDEISLPNDEDQD